MTPDAAHLLALDPVGLGGVALRAPFGPVRDAWLAALRAMLPDAAPWRRIPPDLPDNRLLGGLDLTATLSLGKPVAEHGVLAAVDQGLLLVAMAERMAPTTAARITAAMDQREITVEREGLRLTAHTRFALVLLDEGIEPEERPPAALLERLAFRITPDTTPKPMDLSRARALLPRVSMPMEMLEALVAAAAALGVASPRATLFAIRAARAAAAIAGRRVVADDDAALAATLVLAPRATRNPSAEQDESPPPPPPEDNSDTDETPPPPSPDQLQELLLAAAAANLPAHLLDEAQLKALSSRAGGGRAGAARQHAQTGRPMGARAGEPRGNNRLAVLDTLRAAAPWQALRTRPPHARIAIRREDFRIRQFKRRNETTSIFAVDASGSSALHRLAEAKGAVELLLADCYVRRDRVALVAFRGQAAEVLLPPTHALARAKRSLAALPGGGPTPLASGLDAALELARAEERAGRAALVVIMTDGRANIARDGTPGAARAQQDAMESARALRLAGVSAILLDTAPRPQPAARALADAAGAVYLPMPAADAQRMSRAVGAAVQRLEAA
ncbi:MAG: magnesium chelatase subunit D [Alphaproteobacteria bacterium]|nr:magnesium chelatase subunit D [Alphaproteobacteria bacterium]